LKGVTAVVTDLIRSRGQHRLTWRERITAQVRQVTVPFAVVVAFWGVTIAISGFVAGWVWARAL
jgi:hypothetical protein